MTNKQNKFQLLKLKWFHKRISTFSCILYNPLTNTRDILYVFDGKCLYTPKCGDMAMLLRNKFKNMDICELFFSYRRMCLRYKNIGEENNFTRPKIIYTRK